MFLRRKKPSKVKQFGEFFWPSIGFRRSSKYVGYRLARMRGTPYSLAAGFAFGAAVSFTPFIGFHFILSGILAWIFRANILASALGTVIGNPWTFPFIWALIYNVGNWLMGHNDGHATFDEATLRAFFHGLWAGDWEHITHIFLNVIHPMLIGSIPISILVWIIFFYPLKALIRRFHHRRAKLIGQGRQRNEPPGRENGNGAEVREK